MGCCENKFLNTDIILFPERTAEVKRGSFDSISIYSEEGESKKLEETTNNINSCLANTYNGFEKAFLTGYHKSRTQSLIIQINN